MHRSFVLVFSLMNRCGFALAPSRSYGSIGWRAGSSVADCSYRMVDHSLRGMRYRRFVATGSARDPFHDSFGAPLPPIEMSIDAARVEVAASVWDGDGEAWSVVQQLRGSAPYVELHRDSIMVVHLCSELLDDDSMSHAAYGATGV